MIGTQLIELKVELTDHYDWLVFSVRWNSQFNLPTVLFFYSWVRDPTILSWVEFLTQVWYTTQFLSCYSTFSSRTSYDKWLRLPCEAGLLGIPNSPSYFSKIFVRILVFKCQDIVRICQDFCPWKNRGNPVVELWTRGYPPRKKKEKGLGFEVFLGNVETGKFWD